MEKKHNQYGSLLHEIFEMLIPAMLYQGTEKEKGEFFQMLRYEGNVLIRDMFKNICEDDGLLYPHKNMNFEVKIFERGGVNLLQILPSSDNSIACDILRAYVLFTRNEDKKNLRRYFAIKKFADGKIFNLYVNPEMKSFLGEELTRYTGDMEYEYWKLVNDYVRVLMLEWPFKP